MAAVSAGKSLPETNGDTRGLVKVSCRSMAQAILAAWTFACVEVQSDGTQLGERRGRDYLGLADRLPLVEHIGDIQSWVALAVSTVTFVAMLHHLAVVGLVSRIPRIPSTQSH